MKENKDIAMEQGSRCVRRVEDNEDRKVDGRKNARSLRGNWERLAQKACPSKRMRGASETY